ncbi:hypothetical protein K2173_011263 [Erythroxylum novogranatense]|uniref:Uncharacterized protein n=1 Tax=Erythroxylum novogranatense TaxID=1862640 RepID=A0AAV8S9D9_9ROSI|nr:hypothetical protein K2173_011263 [Erythroxylum novogranatense]
MGHLFDYLRPVATCTPSTTDKWLMCSPGRRHLSLPPWILAFSHSLSDEKGQWWIRVS